MKNQFSYSFLVFILIAVLKITSNNVSARSTPLKLWYDKPAMDWMTEALPIGNGRLGGMIFGGIDREHIQFNEISLWTGNERETGAYQAFGDLFIDFDHPAEVLHYKRELNIKNAVHTINYASGGVRYKREYFSSARDQVMVFRISADKNGNCSGVIRLTDMHNGKIVASDNKLAITGELDNGLLYEAGVLVLNDGGIVNVSEGSLLFEKTNSITLILAAGTNYLPDYSKNWKGENPHQLIDNQ